VHTRTKWERGEALIYPLVLHVFFNMDRQSIVYYCKSLGRLHMTPLGTLSKDEDQATYTTT
jgi:hypothetical protein